MSSYDSVVEESSPAGKAEEYGGDIGKEHRIRGGGGKGKERSKGGGREFKEIGMDLFEVIQSLALLKENAGTTYGCNGPFHHPKSV